MPERIPVTEVNATKFENADWRTTLNDYRRVILAEGDSWFSYGSTKFRNLPSALTLPDPTCVLNIAEPGDTLRRMHETTRNPELYFYLRNKGGRRWNAILLSGGGNDLIDAIWNKDDQRSEILVRPADPALIDASTLRQVVNEEALAALLGYIRTNVGQIVEEGRDGGDGESRDVPLFMHTYALVQPRDAPVKHLGQGPWLYPACVWLGIDPRLWLDLSRMLLGELAACLKSIDLPNFFVVDTLAETTALMPAEPGSRGHSNDWENEIHPDRHGYKKLAATWSDELERLP
jgi:hypothetical protein